MVKIKTQLKELIENYRQRLHGVIDLADDAVLRQWQEDEGANEALNALAEIVSHIEEIEKQTGNVVKPDFKIEMAALLIPTILSTRYNATREDEDSSGLVELRRKRGILEKKVRAKLARTIRSGQIPIQRLSAFLRLVTAKLGQVQTSGNEPAPIQVRSGKGQTRTRTLFIRNLSNLIHNHTDRWMDEQVAALAALVLGCEIDAATVRNTRRPTTRKARKTNRRHGTR